jgi:hypothetical protein
LAKGTVFLKLAHQETVVVVVEVLVVWGGVCEVARQCYSSRYLTLSVSGLVFWGLNAGGLVV